ncbi:MAG: hypothetical protein CMM93_00905 [Rickettsiales bacterium]|nr:hypothetical protein [Rickettsiales bacterium]|tara:strand:- start:76 stop:408 length:333 start_codon:yes stop_codon:yes gene_type:complete
MKLITIVGQLWELTILQNTYNKTDRILDDKLNKNIVSGGFGTDTIRVKAGDVRSKAKAIIETTVHGLPTHIAYDIYKSSRGFYCNVQRERVYLKDIYDESCFLPQESFVL